MIYTSGSTGAPKGVIVAHREFTNYLQWAHQLYEPHEGNGAPLNTPLSFDATITSLFLPMVSGRPVILLPEAGQLEALAALLMSGNDLTLVKLTPAHLQALKQMS